MQCKDCSHDFDDHHLSSDSDDVEDSSSDNSHVVNPPPNTRNKRVVSSLVSDLIRDGEYTRGEVENAQTEMRAGLMKRHVGRLATH